ncbi:hypothetical protein [Escherichia coli]|nr:hypothetical protein [Escherichia coli]ACD54483.1 hypothetical protein Ec53638_A0380 [Escherichia coli 53638]
MSRKTQRYSTEFKAEAVKTVPENLVILFTSFSGRLVSRISGAVQKTLR